MTGAEKVATELSIDALDPADRPPIDRYCDVVMEGGVINGVVYPGFLIELARKFNFHAIAGSSVGAIAGALAAACEYSRRFGSDNGFNEGLAKMPQDLAEWVVEGKLTKIQSLFQPEKEIKPLFDWAVDLIGSRVNPANETRLRRSEASVSLQQTDADLPKLKIVQTPSLKRIWKSYWNFFDHFSPFRYASQMMTFRRLSLLALLSIAVFLTLSLLFASAAPSLLKYGLSIGLVSFCFFVLCPVLFFVDQLYCLVRMPGFGMCTGMRALGDKNASLVEWLHEGIQKAAQLPLHKPLTFGELWRAPGGPMDERGNNVDKSIDLRMITTCLSQGRIYELPQKHSDTPIMFRLSELKAFFPPSVIDHLRRYSRPIDVGTNAFLKKRFFERRMGNPDRNSEIGSKLEICQVRLQKLFDELEQPDSKDIRVLPAADLPIVVAARMSMSCPVLFQAIPFLGLNLDKHAEDMEVVRLWFSDGGIGSNFPIHIFDQAIPKWPTLGLKLLDEAPRQNSNKQDILTFLPFFHYLGAEDNLIFPNDKEAWSQASKKGTWGTFIQFVLSIYTSAKDGHDQSYLRMPDVRNRVVRAYMNNRAGNALNLKIEPDVIKWLGCKLGVEGGKNAVDAYLADLENEKYRDKVNLWQDHRWVRMRMLIDGLRQYLSGVGQAINFNQLPGSKGQATLRDQIAEATNTPDRLAQNITATPQLRSQSDIETALTVDQAAEINAALDAIVALEKQLADLDLPQAYVPEPQPVLRFKPQY